MDILNDNKCPITHNLLTELNDPVIDIDGYTYERSAIESWLRDNGTSPITRKPMQISDLRPNRALHVENTEITTQKVSKKKICVIWDISGSMSEEATFLNDNGNKERSGLTNHDLAKHSITTIIYGLSSEYELSIVTFSTNPELLLPLTFMDESGKKLALEKIEQPRPGGCTNMWQAIVLGFKNVKDNGYVYLLTDGQPTSSPPRGWDNHFNKFLEDNQDIKIKQLRTIGFGYNLDAKLLQNLAHRCNGGFLFVPDSGMIATVFIHALANTLIDTQKKTNKDVEKFLKFLNVLINLENNNLQINVGQQIIKDYKTSNPVIWEEEVEIAFSNQEWYNRWGKIYIRSLYDAHLLQECNNFKDKTVQNYKTPETEQLVDKLDKIFCDELPPPKPTQTYNHYRGGGTLPQPSNLMMRSFSQPTGGCFSGNCRISTDRGTKLLRHLKKGDMLKTENGYNRLVCVMKSVCHNNQIDLVEFDSKLELEYDTDTDIPPLECIDCDKFYSLGGKINESEYDIKPDQEFCECTKLLVTPWHPIKHEGNWEFPNNLRKTRKYEMPFVYSFVVENSNTVYIEGWECITLGHGIENDTVASHDFWGTEKVIDCLKTKPGWKDGEVIINRSVRDVNNEVYYLM